ncbi:hypothetical protein AB4Y64_07490 [Lysobacter sp. TAF61]|uniref:hypothetical protein n=1 Tax=Lysobacter sp. TAF61 TaxID=3233072 RepID=UPI003F9CC083
MRFVLFAALALASFTAAADGNAAPKSLDIVAITTQQKQIQQDIIAQRGPYKDLPDTTRVELLSRQATMMRMLDGKASESELSQDQRAEVFNTLEWMEVAINRESDDERLICRREKPLGSTRTERICRTAAQEREAKDRAREDFENLNNFKR